jgi:hypothetical protein
MLNAKLEIKPKNPEINLAAPNGDNQAW